MINIDLSNQDIYEDYNNLFQWDYGQSLAISGLNVTSDIEVHFARKNTDAEIRLGTYSNGIVTVSIPDMILQKSGKFSAYIYQTNATSGETIKVIHMNVREREQPTDYTTPEYENIVYELNSKLEQIIATGIANYQPDPAVVDALVTQKVNAMLSTLGDMALKDQVEKLDLTTALAAELDGKINSSKITTTLAPTQTGFIHDAKTVGDAITTINNNLIAVNYAQNTFTFNSTIVSEVRSFICKKVGNEVILDVALTVTGIGTVISSIPVSLRPLNAQNGYGINYDGSVGGTVIALIVVSANGVSVTTWSASKPYLTMQIRWRLDM